MSLHNPISHLRAYYVQKVLPAVYDDSLSYYEILCKVQETLNEVVSTTNEQSVVVLEMQQAINDFIHGGYTDTFEEYLDEWFEENSDAFVQRLIDEGIIPEVSDIQADLLGVHASIDSMQAEGVSIRNDMVAADTALTNTKVPYPLVGETPSYGTNGQVLATNADGTTDWQNPVVPSDEQAEEVITQWLNDHPEATTTVPDNYIFTSFTNSTATTLSDLNNAEDNKVYVLFAAASSTKPSNWPDASFSGFMVLITFTCIGTTQPYDGYKLQMVCGVNGCYVRYYSAGAWQSWNKISMKSNEVPPIVLQTLNGIINPTYGGALQTYPTFLTNNVSTLSDLNDAEPNIAYIMYYTSSYQSRPSNWPAAIANGMTTVISLKSADNHITQLAISDKGIMCVRLFNVNWSTWTTIGYTQAQLNTAIQNIIGEIINPTYGGALQTYPTFLVNNVSTLSDLNDAEPNIAYIMYYTSSYQSRPSNWPAAIANGMTTVISLKSTDNHITQLAISDKGIMCVRLFNVNWSTWTTIGYTQAQLNTAIQNVTGKTITIDAGGQGDFTSLVEGLAYAYQYPNTKVLVKSGTYDILSEMGGSEWAESYSYATDGAGPVIGNGMHVVFESKALVTFKYEDATNTDLMENFSPFNAGLGDFVIENLTLESKNCRYGFHDELAASTTPYSHKFLRCKMTHDDSANAVFTNKPAIGGGLGKCGDILISDCILIALTSTQIAAASYHNTSASDSRSRVIITGCYAGENNSFSGTARGQSQLVSEFIVSNCSVAFAPQVSWNTPTQPYENMVLYAWNNEIRSS